MLPTVHTEPAAQGAQQPRAHPHGLRRAAGTRTKPKHCVFAAQVRGAGGHGGARCGGGGLLRGGQCAGAAGGPAVRGALRGRRRRVRCAGSASLVWVQPPRGACAVCTASPKWLSVLVAELAHPTALFACLMWHAQLPVAWLHMGTQRVSSATGARVVAKRSPSEKVGVFARRGDAIEVVEYSELGAAEAEAALEGVYAPCRGPCCCTPSPAIHRMVVRPSCPNCTAWQGCLAEAPERSYLLRIYSNLWRTRCVQY